MVWGVGDGKEGGVVALGLTTTRVAVSQPPQPNTNTITPKRTGADGHPGRDDERGGDDRPRPRQVRALPCLITYVYVYVNKTERPPPLHPSIHLTTTTSHQQHQVQGDAGGAAQGGGGQLAGPLPVRPLPQGEQGAATVICASMYIYIHTNESPTNNNRPSFHPPPTQPRLHPTINRISAAPGRTSPSSGRRGSTSSSSGRRARACPALWCLLAWLPCCWYFWGAD